MEHGQSGRKFLHYPHVQIEEAYVAFNVMYNLCMCLFLIIGLHNFKITMKGVVDRIGGLS